MSEQKTEITMIGDSKCPNCEIQSKLMDEKLDTDKFTIEKVYEDDPKYDQLTEKHNIELVPSYIINEEVCVLVGTPEDFALQCGDKTVEIQKEK